MPLSPVQIINNRYRIVKLLSQGEYGVVYRTWDMHMGCACALKENLDTTPEAQKQFKREAQILGDLTHSNLPKVIDHFVIPGQGQYLVMEFIKGQDLQAMLNARGRPLSEIHVLEWIGQVCDALTYLHSQIPPVIHRDIKPANIKITPQNKAVLVDFGITKIYDRNLITKVGAHPVSPGYSPPEQYGKGTTDARSDVYALGATCYTLLTGRIPPDSVDIMTKRIKPPPPVRSLNPKVTPEVSAAIEKAMQLDCSHRFQTISEFKASLSQPLRVTHLPTELVIQPTVAPAKPLSHPLPWNRIGAIGALSLLVLFLLVLVFGNVNVISEGKGSYTPTANVLAALSTISPSSMELTVFVTSTPTDPPNEILVSHPTTEILDTYTSQIPSLSPTIGFSHTPAPFSIMITEWHPFHFVEITSECVVPDAPCWKGSCSDYRKREGGMTINSAKLTGETEVFIDPEWDSPYLIFWSKYNFMNASGRAYTSGRKGDAIIEVKVNNLVEYLKIYEAGNPKETWIKEFLDLSKYKGENIQFIFSAQCPNEWYLQDIQIIPAFVPPP